MALVFSHNYGMVPVYCIMLFAMHSLCVITLHSRKPCHVTFCLILDNFTCEGDKEKVVMANKPTIILP